MSTNGLVDTKAAVGRDTPSHPLQTSIDVASLAPNAEVTVFPWREPLELKARTINRVRTFLKSHLPMRAAAPTAGRSPEAALCRPWC